MTEKDKEIQELRRRVAYLEQKIYELNTLLDKTPTVEEAVQLIRDHCNYNDECRKCKLHDTEGCRVQNSPYNWRMPK
jgi:hypothetical protein